MTRRPGPKRASRVAGPSAVPTPTPSSQVTPLSSAYTSTYASEDEGEQAGRMIARYPLHSITLRDLDARLQKSTKTPKPFRFMDLPPELRVKIYHYHFAGVPKVIDLAPDNHKRIHKKLAIFRTCRTVYREASHAFLGTHIFRLFPTHGLFYKTKKPLLARMTSRQRALISSVELRVGPGFNKPPRSWKVNSGLGLADCTNVRHLDIYVECDPSDTWFNGFRRADGFYEDFCGSLLGQVLHELPTVRTVCFDGNAAVRKSGAMMLTLLRIAKISGKDTSWGPARGWTDAEEQDAQNEEDGELLHDALVPAIALLGVSGPSVAVVA